MSIPGSYSVPLAPHGTWVRAQICEDSCPDCGPKRARAKETGKQRRARDTEASRDGKRTQGRL